MKKKHADYFWFKDSDGYFSTNIGKHNAVVAKRGKRFVWMVTIDMKGVDTELAAGWANSLESAKMATIKYVASMTGVNKLSN